VIDERAELRHRVDHAPALVRPFLALADGERLFDGAPVGVPVIARARVTRRRHHPLMRANPGSAGS
jgi:hypothetical protein